MWRGKESVISMRREITFFGLLFMLGFSCCGGTGEPDATDSTNSNTPLPGYPLSPTGSSFIEEFDSSSLDPNIFEIRDGYNIWDSWYDQTKVTISGGKLLLRSDANDTHSGLVDVGGINTIGFYSYGKLEFRAKTNAARGMVSSLYLYNEDKDRSNGGTHEEIDVELSSLHTGKASLVAFHGDNWENDALQNEMHRGRIKDLREISGLENYDSTQMNNYSVEWKEGIITWTVNDIQVEQLTQAVPTTPMQIIIDTNHNNSWGEFIDPTVSGVGSFEIERIKYTVY